MASGNDKKGQEAPNTLLTTDQRKYLSGEQEYNKSDQARWQMYSRVRNRLRWTIYDFALLGGHYHENWGELNLDKVFTEDYLDHARVRDGATGILYVLYRGLFDDYMPAFEHHLQDGIALAELHMNNRHVNPSLTINRPEYGNVIVDSALSRINPDDVDTLRIPEMRAVLNTIAESDIDIAGLIWEEMDGEPLFGRNRD